MNTVSPFWSQIASDGKEPLPRIGFTDGADERILRAVADVIERKFFHPVLVGDPAHISEACRKASIDIDPKYFSAPLTAPDRQRYARLFVEKQRAKNLSMEAALSQLDDPLYEGVALLIEGRLDGLVAGSTRPTADVVKAAIHYVGSKPNQKLVSGHFFIESDVLHSTDKTPFLFADCAVVPEPSPRALALIAVGAAASYRFFTGQTPRIALLSFSTRGSAEHELVDRIREALELVRKQEPELIVDGELQVDAALDAGVAVVKKASDSAVAGRANVFIFPTLESGNIGYKLVQRFSSARVAGPLLWGLNKPVSDLSRGCTVQEVRDTALCVSTMVRKAV